MVSWVWLVVAVLVTLLVLSLAVVIVAALCSAMVAIIHEREWPEE